MWLNSKELRTHARSLICRVGEKELQTIDQTNKKQWVLSKGEQRHVTSWLNFSTLLCLTLNIVQNPEIVIFRSSWNTSQTLRYIRTFLSNFLLRRKSTTSWIMFYLADSERESGPGLSQCSCQAGALIGQLGPIPGLWLVSQDHNSRPNLAEGGKA